MNERLREFIMEAKPCSILWFAAQAEPFSDPTPDDPPNVVGRYRDFDGVWHVVIDADYREVV